MVNLIVSALAELLAEALNMAVEVIAPLLGFSFTQFNSAFPYAATAYSIIQSFSLGIVLLIATAQLVPFIFGVDKRNTSPFRIAGFVILAVCCIYYGNYILSAIINIAENPYNALLYADVEGELNFFEGLSTSFASAESVLADVFYSGSIILYLVLFIMLGIAFLKVLLEAVERYVILFILVYLSPLFSSTIASDATNGIAKRFFTTFLSQCLLLLVNIWGLKMVCSMFDGLSVAENKLLMLLMGYAMLRLIARFDSYLGQLGMNALTTGAGLGGELFATGMALAHLLGGSRSMGGGSPAGGGSGAGKVLGKGQPLVDGLTGFVGKYSPVAGASDAAKNTIGGLYRTGKQGANAAREAMAGANGIGNKAKSGVDAFVNSAKDNLEGNLHDASLKTQGTSWWARQMGGGMDSIEDMRDSLANGASLSPEQLHDLENNPWMAQELDRMCAEGNIDLNDSTTVAAMAAGMVGQNNMSPEMQEAYNAAMGNIDADDVNFTSDANGMHMAWSYNGQDHKLDLVNQAQFNRMSPEAQKAFSAIPGSNGLYSRSDTTRTLSDTQKAARAASDSINEYFRSGGSTPLSTAAYEGIRKNPAQWSIYQQGLRSNGMTVDGSTPEGAKAVRAAIGGIKAPTRELQQAQTEAMQRLGTGDFDRAYNDGNKFGVEWHDSDGKHSLSFISPDAAAGISSQELRKGNYSVVNMNGEDGLGVYSRPPTAQEKAASELSSIVNSANSGTGQAAPRAVSTPDASSATVPMQQPAGVPDVSAVSPQMQTPISVPGSSGATQPLHQPDMTPGVATTAQPLPDSGSVPGVPGTNVPQQQSAGMPDVSGVSPQMKAPTPVPGSSGAAQPLHQPDMAPGVATTAQPLPDSGSVPGVPGTNVPQQQPAGAPDVSGVSPQAPTPSPAPDFTEAAQSMHQSPANQSATIPDRSDIPHQTYQPNIAPDIPIVAQPVSQSVDIPSTPIPVQPNVVQAPAYSPDTIAALRKDPSMIVPMRQEMASGDVQIQDAPHLTAATFNDLNMPSSMSKARTAMNDAVSNGNVIADQFDAHESQISFSDGNGGTYTMQSLDQTAAENRGYTTPQSWQDAGYFRTTNKSGEFQYVAMQYDGPKTQPEQLSDRVRQFASGAEDVTLSSQDYSQFGKQDINNYFSGLSDSKRTFEVDYTFHAPNVPTQEQTVALDQNIGIMTALQNSRIQFNGPNPMQSMLDAARAGEVTYSKTSSLGMVQECVQDNRIHRMTILTDQGVKENRMSKRELRNAGFAGTNINGQIYWSKYEEEALDPDDTPRDRSRRRRKI